MAIREYFIPTGTNAFISLNLDSDKYSSILLTALGIQTTIPTGSQKYPYRSIKQALESSAVVRLKARVRNATTKKRRICYFVCDRDKADTAASELVGKTVKIGLGTGVSYDITRVTSG